MGRQNDRAHRSNRGGQQGFALVDVRSPAEYSGELLAPANLPQEGAQRGGHIPGAANIPWSQAVNADGTFKSADELRDAFAAYVAAGAPEAYVLYRELDYFEQLAALERWGAFDLELIKLLLGRTLVDRWEMWRPAIHRAHGAGAYPLFEGLVEKLRRELGSPMGGAGL